MSKKRTLGKIRGFSLQFIPFNEIRNLSSSERIKKILDIILGNNILLLQGRLLPEEESRLIEDTMAMIRHVKTFRGIELAVIAGNNHSNIFQKARQGIANAISGGDLGAITIIGPATIVKEIKKNPRKIELLLNR